MRIYISGKMTGLPDLGRQKFMETQSQLEMYGHTVLNPALLPPGLEKSAYMPMCLAVVDAAEAVYMLDNWKQSPGAQLEHDYAMYQGKLIIYSTEEVSL